MIKIQISNKLYLDNLPPIVKKSIKKTLTLNNPTFHLMKSMKKSVWGIPRHIKYYEQDGGDALTIPRGMLTRFKTFLDNNDLKYQIISDDRVEKKLSFALQEFELRDYQKVIIDRVFPGDIIQEGIITMTTGAGKTAMAVEIARRLGLYTTIIVPNKVIMNQFIEEFRNFTGYRIGVLNGDIKQLKPITVATWAILRNKSLLRAVTAQTGVLILDEVQGCVTAKRRAILQEFKAKYMYGLTATPARSGDGQTNAIFFLAGNEIENYKGKQLKPRVEVWHTNLDIPFRPEYHEMIDYMIENDERNRLITYIVMEELSAGKKVLVLTKRIQHYKNLEKMMPKIDGVYYMDSKDPDRDWTLSGMRDGLIDFNVIFGTTSLLAVGTDIPRLDTLVIACDMKSEVLTTQAAGRIRRLFEGKKDPKVIDLHDNRNFRLNKQAKHRVKLYNSKQWGIKEINYEK